MTVTRFVIVTETARDTSKSNAKNNKGKWKKMREKREKEMAEG
jgi:hypothetical protein